MPLDRRLLAFIADRNPAVFDVVPRAGQFVSLKPTSPGVAGRVADLQPTTPGNGDVASLNPQPLPPREIGARVAADLLHLDWLASRLKNEVTSIAEWEEDPCPSWPNLPKLPPHLGPVPDPDPGPDWLREYHVGLASTLARATVGGGSSRLVEEALELSSEALSAALG